MILDAKQARRLDFITSRQKNGDIIVKFDENPDDIDFRRTTSHMHYVGTIKELPKIDKHNHRLTYDNGIKCEVGDVVFVNGCHYVLGTSEKLPFVEWINLDTSKFEFDKLIELESKISSINSKYESISNTALMKPIGNGKEGQILALSSSNELAWIEISSIPGLSNSVQLIYLSSDTSVPTPQINYADTGFIVGVLPTQISSSNPEIYQTNIALSSIENAISMSINVQQQLSSTHTAIISQLSVLNTSKTIGQMRNSLLKISDLINKIQNP